MQFMIGLLFYYLVTLGSINGDLNELQLFSDIHLQEDCDQVYPPQPTGFVLSFCQEFYKTTAPWALRFPLASRPGPKSGRTTMTRSELQSHDQRIDADLTADDFIQSYGGEGCLP